VAHIADEAREANKARHIFLNGRREFAGVAHRCLRRTDVLNKGYWMRLFGTHTAAQRLRRTAKLIREARPREISNCGTTSLVTITKIKSGKIDLAAKLPKYPAKKNHA
jgi:hypothetical protein